MADPYRTAPTMQTWHIELTARLLGGTVVHLHSTYKAETESDAIRQAFEWEEKRGFYVLACVGTLRSAADLT